MSPAFIQDGNLFKRCEECGREAYFSAGTNLRQALRQEARGQKAQAKRSLGLWYCAKHWKEKK